jgi:hypothetical protein
MAAKHQKAAFPLLYRAIGADENIPTVFFTVNHYGTEGKFVYLSHEI